MGSSRGWLPRLVVGVVLLLLAVQGSVSEHEPTESECRPYIKKALQEHHIDTDAATSETSSGDVSIEQEENSPKDDLIESLEEVKTQESEESGSTENDGASTDDQLKEANTDTGENEDKTEEQNDTTETTEGTDSIETADTNEATDEGTTKEETGENEAPSSQDNTNEQSTEAQTDASPEGGSHEQEAVEATQEESDTKEETVEGDTVEDTEASVEGDTNEESAAEDAASVEGDTVEETDASIEGDTVEETEASIEGDTVEEASIEGDTAEDTQPSGEAEDLQTSVEGDTAEESTASVESDTAEEQKGETAEVQDASIEGDTAENQGESVEGDTVEQDTTEESEGVTQEQQPESEESGQQDTAEVQADEASADTTEGASGEGEESKQGTEESQEGTTAESVDGEGSSLEGSGDVQAQDAKSEEVASAESGQTEEQEVSEVSSGDAAEQEVPEEDLTQEAVIPSNLRSHDHITQILKLDESAEKETAVTKAVDSTLKTLKSLYDNAIKPLEMLYKYRDLSNRHFGDPEIFSKPLILFMGPWSGGKSSTINYLLDNEFGDMSLRTGAEPSPAYFNILMHGDEPEIMDGTQLAADWTFSGLQKFGQGLLDRLRGVRLPNKLLEKVNIVEIPGILEIRKQVQRLFPFNDACQWFIDRADIIFLVYDPAKLDVGPETEAILDQLKGREYQTRIILNKADQVKPEELMRVQGTLIWNISPLMSSQEPPVMYTTSLWSLPYEPGAPARLLYAQERAFLRDLREAIEKRVENKIASARRFAVRVRNHAKMVDCYLTTYYNHKTFFGNKKKVSDDIIENPTKYHIYEGLSTLTNISRYDLPDPEMYRDFFRINPLYDFTKLSDTCTYFRGCPINKLDIAIAYDLPEVVGKYKKAVEASKSTNSKS